MNSVVTTLAPSFLIGSSSFLQTTRTDGFDIGQYQTKDL